jgi:predicted glutamine amidotransferase
VLLIRQARKKEQIMCGLAGLVIGRKERSPKELRAITKRFSNLMVATQIRGRHATGAFVVSKSGIEYHKAPLPADKMVKTDDWKKLMQGVDNDTVAIVGHVRFATQGSPSDNSNNHPIIQDNIIGVHNGVILNDCEICDKYPYEEEVDSAAIFSMLSSKSIKSRLSTAIIGDALPELSGDFAIMVADARRTDSIFVARDASRPLGYVKDYKNQLLWLSSTGDIAREGLGDNSIKLELFPTYSVARIGRKHAEPTTKVRYSKWYTPVKISPVTLAERGKYSTANIWDENGQFKL